MTEALITSLFFGKFMFAKNFYPNLKKRSKYLGWNIVVRFNHGNTWWNLNKNVKSKSALIGYLQVIMDHRCTKVMTDSLPILVNEKDQEKDLLEYVLVLVQYDNEALRQAGQGNIL